MFNILADLSIFESVEGFISLIITSFISIITIVNPLAVTPAFLSMTRDNSDQERATQVKWASIYMFFILLTFLLLGTYILQFFGISMPGIRIAGGLIILKVGYGMMDPDSNNKKLSAAVRADAIEKQDISFSPLAMPMMAGPGSIAVVIGLGSQVDVIFDYGALILALVMVVLVTFGVLAIAPKAVKYLGASGLTVMTRMMGFLALSIGVQFIISGISRFFQI